MCEIPENRLLKRPPDTVNEIRKIYNLETPERLAEAISILEDWIQKQDHIIKKDFSRDYLERSIILCKGSVEKAKKQIDRLCTMKTMVPKFFNKINVKVELKRVLELAMMIPLPNLTKDYYRVLLVKMNFKDLTTETCMQYFQSNIILSEYLKANDYNNGIIVVDDYRETNLVELMTKINAIELQQYITILTEGYGGRLKSFNIITASKTIELLIKAFKPLVSEKIGNRVNVHRNEEELHAVVPKEILPVEYGGNEKPLAELCAEWVEELSSEKHVEYVKMMSKACTDETKRRDVKFTEEYMGMPGSFRNLTVD